MQDQARSQSSEVVVITGASAGIGRATTRRFAEAGARLALLARGRDGLEAAVREAEARGGRAIPIQVDVADAEAVFAAADRIEAELGPIDVWINNAMTTVFGRAEQLSARELQRVTEVTYLGTVWGTLAALRKMRPRRRGTIVQVGSALSYRAIPLQAAYCGAKHAIRGFTDSLRSELLHDDVPVQLTMVQLPAVNTPQFSHCENKMPFQPQPVPPIYQPEVAAESIYWAAHHHRRELYVGLPAVKAIIGQKLLPGVLDSYLANVGFDRQFTDEPAPPAYERQSNLFEPVPGDLGAHGPFDRRARDRAPAGLLAARLGAAGVRALVVLITLSLVALLSVLAAT